MEDTMTLTDIYAKAPGNYLLRADGGYGKTTQMRDLQKKLWGKACIFHGKRRTIVPIYLPMAEINRIRSHVDKHYLCEVLRGYFNHETGLNAVKEMLKHPDYLFLFLLDGVNEILRDTSPDDRIYSVLADQIGEMMEEYPDTVNFILSTRTGCSVFDSESLEEKFTQLTICGFDRNKLEKFLPTELADDLLENLLKTPMLLYLYRQIRTEQPEKTISQKSDLMQEYVNLDRIWKRGNPFRDGIQDLRRKAIEEVLPLLAFELERMELNRDGRMEGISLKQMLAEIVEPEYIDAFYEVIRMTGLADENLHFCHQIFQEFFAAKGFVICANETKKEQFLIGLNQSLKYKGKKDYDRRTQFLDTAEFLYSIYGKNLPDALKQSDISNYLALAQEFYQELAGVYDDLKVRFVSAQAAWISYDLLLKRTDLSPFERARSLNFLFYSVLNFTGERMDEEELSPLNLLKEADALLEKQAEPEAERELIQFRSLKGKILSNYGAFYTSKYCGNPAYEEALKWHRKALEYREKKDPKSVIESIRTILSDYYHLGRPEKAYLFYLKGLTFLNGHTEIRRGMDLDIDYVERGLGSEIQLYKEHFRNPEKAEPFSARMTDEIDFVYTQATRPNGRKDKNNLRNLKKKLQDLHNWHEEQEASGKFPDFVKEYLEKCSKLV